MIPDKRRMGRGDGMSYRIVYGPDPIVQQPGKESVRKRVLTASCFLIFVWLVRLSWSEGREVLVRYLLPGEPTHAQAVFSVLLDNLRHGMGMVDSLTVFCREILYEIP